jgi:RES domain-containing protein
MRSLWRISEYPDLSGAGGRLGSARWHTKGKPVVYLAESPAGAMLERIVHLLNMDEDGNGDLPLTYTLLHVSVPDGFEEKALNTLALTEWKAREELTRQMGDAWLASRETSLARVPSAILPRTWNYLLNPNHPQAAQIQIVEVIKERFDNRLFHFGPR